MRNKLAFAMAMHAVLATLTISNPASAAASASVDTPNIAPCISWRNPLKEPRFALLCVHGLGLYSRSYQHFGQRIARLGAVVYAIDVRGFGSWMQAQGQKDMDFDGCLEDIRTALLSIHAAHPNLPVFLLGESMGGAIALRAATMYPDLINGVISAVPAAERFQQKRTDLKVALQVLTGPRKKHENIGKQVVEQAATAQNPADPSSPVLDQKLAQAWEDDPLDRLDLSAKDLIQFQKFMNENHDAVKKLKVPVLFVQGLDDSLVRPDGTWDLLKDVAYNDRSLIAIPARHLMFEEQQVSDPKAANAATHVSLAWILSHMQERNGGDDPQVRQVSAPTAARVTQGKPTVVAFYAKWCDQCDRLGAFVDRAQRQGRGAVRFTKIDVDDPANADLVKEFQVGALPSVVFLRPDGTITSTLIGETTLPVIVQGIADLLKH